MHNKRLLFAFIIHV